jgi:hypothetical protein
MTDASRDIDIVQSDHDLLIRVDQKVSDLVTKIEQRDKQYVTQAEFWPVKMLVYGCTGLMLTSLIGAIVLLVIKV